MSSQRCIHINVMRLYGKWWYNPLFIEGTVTDNVPEEVWKVKNNIPLLNKAVLSNIYGTDRKQGQRHTFIDTVISGGCHRIQVRKSTKGKSSIVFAGTAYQWIAQGSFQKSNGLCFTVFCVWICVPMNARTHIYHQKKCATRVTAIPDFHYWKKEKLTPCHSLAAGKVQILEYCF